MKPKLLHWSQRYLVALRKHLKQGKQASLESARELGRQALAAGLQTLDLAKIHEHALITELLLSCKARQRAVYIKQAGVFFAVAITPVEETHHDGRRMTSHLRELVMMSQRTVELAVAGGRPPEATPFSVTVTGEQSDLVLEGGAPRGFQSGRLGLSLRAEPRQVDEGETGALPETAANVAGVYAALRDDIRQGTSTAPGFEHTLHLARLVDDVLSAAQTGSRKPVVDWPSR